MVRKAYLHKAMVEKEARRQLKAVALKGERETELDWMTRMRSYGFTDERIHLFQSIRSAGAFIKYTTELLDPGYIGDAP